MSIGYVVVVQRLHSDAYGGWGRAETSAAGHPFAPQEGAWSGARATRGVNQVGDHADRGSDKTAAARVLLAEMLTPAGGPRRGCVRRAARNRPG